MTVSKKAIDAGYVNHKRGATNGQRIVVTPAGLRLLRNHKQKAFIFDMMITILDDYFETLHTLNCFHTIQDQNVTIWNDHCQDSDASSARIGKAEVLALIRERTKISVSLLKKLPNLKLISYRSVYPHVDVDASSRLSVLFSFSQHPVMSFLLLQISHGG